MKLYIFYFTVFVSGSFEQVSTIKFSRYNNNFNKSRECYIHSSERVGICTYANECPELAITNNYSICGHHGLQPKICCPKLNVKLRKCQAACERYKQIVLWKPNQKYEGNRNQYPHIAVLGWLMPDTQLHWNCGGSLISEKFVLSSAHCLINFKKRPHVVRLSEFDLTTNTLGEHYNVLKVIIYPGFKRFQIYHDLALIELNEFVSLRTYLRPVCLVHRSEEIVSSLNIFEMGWFNNKIENQIKLQQNRVLRINEQNCRLSLNPNEIPLMPNGLISSQMCYRSINNLTSCADYVDRSLLLRKTINNSSVYEFVGLFSFCGNGKINVFSDISKYINWIESIVWPE